MDMVMYSATEGTGALARLVLALSGVWWVLAILAVLWCAAVAVGRGFVLKKCGLHPWAAAIPFYSDYEIGLVAGLPNALAMATTLSGFAICLAALLGFVPIVLIAMAVYFALTCVSACGIARAFARPLAYALGLIVLGPIFWMLLGVSDWSYQGSQSAVEVMRTGGVAETYEAQAPTMPEIDLGRAEEVADAASLLSPATAAAVAATDATETDEGAADALAHVNFGAGNANAAAADEGTSEVSAADDAGADAEAEPDEGVDEADEAPAARMNFAEPVAPNEFAEAEQADDELDQAAEVTDADAGDAEVARGSLEDFDESAYDYEWSDADPMDDDDDPPLDEDDQ